MRAPLPFRRLVARIELATSGYLAQLGWVETRATRRSTDIAGNAQPWFTYPAIRFLEARVQPHWRVLEFGSGASTLWWSRRVREVIAIEHDAGWAQQVARDSSAQVLAVPDTDAPSYYGPARDRGQFEVIVVDGIFRPECLLACREWLAPEGVIIVDDAQREEYQAAIEEVVAGGFRRLPFHGPQPVSKHPGCTEVLYRGNNILGI